ncbi:Muscle M-line assembly protein unc-89 [Wickerhamomyces ciferrii]|uniref:Muscle M-line assembly protein unc-89 n=1 Tax=Wickerhamomyces ciferrii (strain ATCC 14091 / BCRC 22168 / CBS 111 / JCM 3599 / NBRC 0793 / NRRL Y-1031 F-60-10) TaxID=1206466 RepID=K0KTP8_WICCF|nr:Muscle M-line assembly protein unc-89 [Wickerhamomyces ciferrii]CCH45397.1 Muscle M-line assembly protein unc-89 [Wickerhamomyces ciferrii]
MSTNDALRSKKQFKSQSVNSLFRQQASLSENQDGKSSTSSLALKKKSNGSTTKLKLVSKKLNTVNRSKLEKKISESPKENSPAPVWNSRSSSPELKNNQITPKGKNDTPSTTKENNSNIENIKNKNIVSNVQETPEQPKQLNSTTQTPETVPSLPDQIPSPDTTQQLTAETTNEEEEDNMWLDLQNQIHNETKNTQTNDSSWASTNTKLASFRKSSQTPTGIQSLNQSPLISTSNNNNNNNDLFIESPVDFFNLNNTRQLSSESIFFNKQFNNNNNKNINNQTPDSMLHNGYPQISSPNIPENNPWSTNFNLWGNDDRQLSAKSDSFLWSPFNQNPQSSIEKNDDPLKRIGLESQTRITSRFFPSPNIKQEKSSPIPTQPLRSASDKFVEELTNKKSIEESIDGIIKTIGPKTIHPSYLKTSTFELELESSSGNPYFSSQTPPPPSSSSSLSSINIPVSFPGSRINSNTSVNMKNNTTQQELKKPNLSTNDQYYPEGFASTFYKRGINNFMFVRELQPKLITSKAKDTVEVRVSLPSIKTNIQAEEDVFFKMRCYIINVSLRELNGRNNNGYKVSQKANGHINNSNYNGNNINFNGKPRFGNSNYKKGHSNGYYRKSQ